MWRQTRKCSENLRDKNCGKWESFFSSESSDFFVIFYRLPGRVGGGGAKSHSAGAPWWIMKVIWKFEDKCPTFIICSGEGGGAWPELFFETPLPLPREPSKLSVFLPFQIIWSARRASKVYKDKDFGFLSLFPEFDNKERLQCCLNPEVHVKGLDLLVSIIFFSGSLGFEVICLPSKSSKWAAGHSCRVFWILPEQYLLGFKPDSVFAEFWREPRCSVNKTWFDVVRLCGFKKYLAENWTACLHLSWSSFLLMLVNWSWNQMKG